MHDNSIAAWRSEEMKLSARAGAVLAWLHVHGPSTDRQVMEGMGFTEPNSVRPRITELIAQGELEEVRNTKCPVTGKTVRIVRVVPAQMELQ